MNKVITRISPSPTNSFCHVGNLRTLLYNYFLAKQNGGKFYVRLEDTDRDRYNPEFLSYFQDMIKWLGIEPDASYWDPDPSIGSFVQSERNYDKHVNHLLNNGFAYYAFDTQEDLAKAHKDISNFKYDSTTRGKMKNSLSLNKDEVQKLMDAKIPFVIRFKVDPNIDVHFKDEVLDDITINTNTLDDKVLIKSNGIGSYHLCNVCDDHDMGITHVLRGQEWVNSTPFHILLYKAFGWNPPKFAHLPLIMNPDGKGKLSKRTASKYGIPIAPIGYTDPSGNFINGWKEEGYFTHTLINALSLVGWNPGNNTELMSMDELIEKFSLDRVNKAGARFDLDKAKWINSHILKNMDNSDLLDHVQLKDNRYNDAQVNCIMEEAKNRSEFLKDLQGQVDLFFLDTPDQNPSNEFVDYIKYLTTSDYKDNQHSHILLISEVEEYCKNFNVPKGKIMKSMRDCLLSGNKGPDLLTIVGIMGKNITMNKIDKFLKTENVL